MCDHVTLRTCAYHVCLLVFFSTTCLGEDVAEQESLGLIPFPPIRSFDMRMDIPPEDVAGWIDTIEARLETTKYDCRSKTELFSVWTGGGDTNVVNWSLVMRRAKDPSSDAERFITVRQELFDNLAIAINEGVATDNRSHRDLLRMGKDAFSSGVTAYDYHISQTLGEAPWSKAQGNLSAYLIFDAVRACMANVQMVESGNVVSLRTHNILLQTVKATIKDNEYTHVLIELTHTQDPSVKKLIGHTFKDEVPVQLVMWDTVNEDSGRPEYTVVTRSTWSEFGSGEDKLLLPKRIKGMEQLWYYSGEMSIELDWDIEAEVSNQLFSKNTLGFIGPAEGAIVGLPKKVQEFLETGDQR
jgi:hypothetical protein